MKLQNAESYKVYRLNMQVDLDIWLAVHQSITFFIITNLIHKFLVHSHKLYKITFFTKKILTVLHPMITCTTNFNTII